MRNALLMTLTISLIALAGCKHAPMAAPRTTYAAVEPFDVLRNNCKNTGAGNKHKSRPVVCVTVFPGGASVDPLVTLAAFKVNGGRNKIKFVSRGQDRYDISFENTDCVDTKDLQCTEECDADVKETAPVGKECKYSVVLSRVEDGKTVRIVLDPIVIIDTE